MFNNNTDHTTKRNHVIDLEPIVVPLRPLENLTAPAIMDTIQNVLNSHQKLKVDSSFYMDIGIIALPKGGGKVYINQLTGENNSLKRKQSIIQIVNDDNMCMARAIAVTWGEDHFHAVVTITGFFSSSYFCKLCLKPYTDKNRHFCGKPCLVCKRLGECPKTDQSIPCPECNMTCRSMACYEAHRDTDEGKKQSQCQRYWRCLTCYRVVNRHGRDLKKQPHVCGEWHCKQCNETVEESHLCYMRALPPAETRWQKLIFFDFECSQNERYASRY
ncbi:uncharacterized protein LOC133198353 [Saccostrea echinata]|uniref:uncharacterized protein LOC133198353 n=1 Tax=Saccostrea echinata TaxID=191078 RepID=UPI002A8083A5|nr:uncharacterized protein LOC133198353 [Saccostrea echinata]